jgi:hypothetical protein
MLFGLNSPTAACAPQDAAASQEKKEQVRPPKAVRRFIEIKTFLAKEMEKAPAFRAGVEEVYRQKLREHSEYAAMVNSQSASAAALQEKQRFDLLYDNPIVQAYVNRLGQSLTPQESSRLYAFKVTLNPIPEARSLSTGTIYISSGLLALVDNEAQLAYALAHEIAHVEREHWKEDVLIEAGMRRYQQHKNRTRRILSRTLTLLVGPLQTELVGFSELTPFSGGWCGNEVFAANQSDLLTPDIRQQAQQATLALGQQLRQVGYRGCFGLDFLLDQDTGALYLGEMNPRITGATPMTSQAMLEAESVPLLLFHLLEWLSPGDELDYEPDVAAFNEQWLRAEGLGGWGQMILEQKEETNDVVAAAPDSGLWQMQSDGTAQFVRGAFSLDAISRENEALFLRTVNVGQGQYKGGSLGRIVLRGRLLTDDYRLQPRAQAWIRSFTEMFRWAKQGVAG